MDIRLSTGKYYTLCSTFNNRRVGAVLAVLPEMADRTVDDLGLQGIGPEANRLVTNTGPYSGLCFGNSSKQAGNPHAQFLDQASHLRGTLSPRYVQNGLSRVGAVVAVLLEMAD